MAELPDLTVFADILTRKFGKKTLKRIDVTVAKKLNVSADELKSALEGHQLVAVKREGKTLHFLFSGDKVLGLHLMLKGELIAINHDEVPRFQILAFRFEKGEGFAVIDMLKQAKPTLQPQPVNVPDALALSMGYFSSMLSKKRTLIKTILMDQKIMRGIGNSYADEILYHAGISPFSTANALPASHINRLFNSINDVLNDAIKDIGTANRDVLKGELKDFMKIHSHTLKTTAKGEEIKTEKIGGRTTYYTDSQQLFI